MNPQGILRPFQFVATLHAAPLSGRQSNTPVDAPEARKTAVEKDFPSFVPGHRTLTFLNDDEFEPDGETSADNRRAATMAAAIDGMLSGLPSPMPLVSAATASAWNSAAELKTTTVAVAVKPVAVEKTKPAKSPPPKFVGAKVLFGKVKSPAPLTPRAIGFYSHGCLSGAVPLPITGPAWQEMRLSRNRNWGHPKLIALIERFAKDAKKLDGWPGLLVGDIAQPRGGPMVSGHASHQVGLDADIWLTPMPDHVLTRQEREDMQATSMLDSTGVHVNPKVFTGKQVALIKRAASYPQVERIFVHPAIKKALCEAAGKDRGWLGKVRPYWGHYYHFHIRIKCPPNYSGCKPQAPPTGDDGCGKEVERWLARVIPAKTPPPLPAKPKPPKPPLMLSDLPNACAAVLQAKPNPVSIPRTALLTTAEVRKILADETAKATAAAAEKAAPATGQVTGAAMRSATPSGKSRTN
jgi:penicillin-insensitive murein endopeptidase